MNEATEHDPAVATLIKDLESQGEGRLLDPIDRNSEILFGLFMVLTFTGTLSVATAGREDVKLMLVAAIGCNIAWGFVDGVMYVLRNLVVRAREATLNRAVRAARRPEQAHHLIATQIGPMAAGLGAPGLERVRLWIMDQPPPPMGRERMTAHDLRSAVGVFLLVFLSTFPVVIPFLLIGETAAAVRASNAVALVMLFVAGSAFGRAAGYRPWRTGFWMVALGVVLVLITIALGG